MCREVKSCGGRRRIGEGWWCEEEGDEDERFPEGSKFRVEFGL
jgi:hypothetical protein